RNQRGRLNPRRPLLFNPTIKACLIGRARYVKPESVCVNSSVPSPKTARRWTHSIRSLREPSRYDRVRLFRGSPADSHARQKAWLTEFPLDRRPPPAPRREPESPSAPQHSGVRECSQASRTAPALPRQRVRTPWCENYCERKIPPENIQPEAGYPRAAPVK